MYGVSQLVQLLVLDYLHLLQVLFNAVLYRFLNLLVVGFEFLLLLPVEIFYIPSRHLACLLPLLL